MTAPVVKKARDDAFQSCIEDTGVQLRQRITQVRRFDAYLAQQRASGQVTPQRASALSLTWNSILKSPGFSRGFPVWFLHEYEAPCPIDPPVQQVAKWMREKLAMSVPAWRRLYNHARVQQIRDAFDKDWSAGGRLFHRAIKAPGAPPVDAIDRTDTFAVQIMRSRKKDTATFRMVHDDLQMVVIGQKWYQNQARGIVSGFKNGLVQLRVLCGSFKTGCVDAATTCHDPEQALSLATGFWSTLWQNQCQVDCDCAEVSEVVQSLPELPQASNVITISEMKNALKSLPVGKARGMDAISNWELKYMCAELQEMLLIFLNMITASGRWPLPLTRARMHLIRKNSTPGDINSTRPICILPNVYRLWGKIMTAKCFKHLKGVIPPCICGSVPGRSAIDLAMQLQSEIEEHIISDKPLYGASLDIHKAFNTLSRPLLAKMCSRLGLSQIWAPYSTFLGRLQRFFTLRQQWSAPVLSDTGVPEGCPISVVMMMITTWSITQSLSDKFPEKKMSSYVDDWTLRDLSPESLVRQLEYVSRMTAKIGLKLSMHRTLSYATTAPARKQLARQLRQHNFPADVSDTGTCLGMQIQARAAKVTDLREKRLLDCTPKVKRLKIMPWSNTRKATLLLTRVFPAMFYGCEFHDMGLHFISHVRSQCNAAVWKDKPYLSHFLAPLLSTRPVYEPWLWILRRIFISFRRWCYLYPGATQLWNKAVHRPLNKHTIGPVTIIMAHLRRLGWSLAENYQVETQDGTLFRLDHISTSQFKVLTMHAWQDWLVPKLRTKLNIPDLISFDVDASCWHVEDPQSEGFLATLRSGGLFTNKVKSKVFAGVSPNCVLCDQPDGMMHRIYSCPMSAKIREDTSAEFLKDLPKSKMVWGLFQRPHAQDLFAKALDALEITDLPMLPPSDTPHLIFTDGSSTQPPVSRKNERYAAFAVRHAIKNSHHSTLVISGILPGRRQTPFRAERDFFAFMCGMSCSMNSIIFTDCKAVWKGITRLQREGWNELHWLSSPDYDLWRVAFQILDVPGRSLITEWVEAHRSLHQAVSLQDTWRIYQNAQVDKSASVNANNLPPIVKTQFDSLTVQNTELEKQRSTITKYMKSIWEAHSKKAELSLADAAQASTA